MATSGKVSSNAYEGRYISFVWSLTSQNIKANTSTIAWRLEGDGEGEASRYQAGNFKVVIDGTTVYSTSQDSRIWLYDGTVVTSGNYTFTHDASGNKSFTVSIQAGIYTYTVNCTGEGSFSLPQISRVSIIDSIAGANITDNLIVNYTEYVGSYTNNLLITINNTTIQTINDYISGVSFTLNESALNSIYNATATSKTANLSFSLETYDGSTLLGTSEAVNKALNINNSMPDIGGASYADIKAATIAITGNDQYIIRNNSTLQLTVTDLSAINGATLKSLSITGGGINQTLTLSGTDLASEVLNLGSVNQSGNFTLTVTLTDSRDFTAIKNINILVYDWVQPTAIISAQRANNFYSTTNVLVKTAYTSLGGNNTIAITARYKKTSETTYSSMTLTDNVTSSITLDNAYDWNLQIIVADRLGSTAYNLIIGRGLPIFFIDRIKNAIGVNCFPKYSDGLEINGVDPFSFHIGDTETISGLVACGLITNNATKLSFSIPLKKSYAGLTASFTSLQIDIRDVGGNATQYAQIVGDSSFTITPITTSENILTVDVDKTASYGVTNDTPVAVSVSATISFS